MSIVGLLRRLAGRKIVALCGALTVAFLLFAFAYATFLYGLFSSLAMPSSDPPRAGWIVLLMLPLVAGALDWVENGLLLWLLESMDGQRQMVVTLASVVASAKWILILVSLIAALVLLLSRREGSRDEAGRDQADCDLRLHR